jgi:hypothetical protein
MSEAHRPGIEYTPPSPAILTVAGREIAVEEWPLGSWPDENRGVDIQAGTADELVIGPRRGAARGAALPALAFLGGAVPLAVVILNDDLPVWLLVGLAALLLFLMVLLLRSNLRRRRWLRFDRRAGRLICQRRVGFSAERVTDWELPLAKIAAVQLLFSGSYSVTETGEQQLPTSRQYYGYELNLVLDDPARGRISLYSFSDWHWVRETGNRIGAFLGVPVIDKLQHGT